MRGVASSVVATRPVLLLDVGRVKWAELYRVGFDRLGDRRVVRWFVEEASGRNWPGALEENVTELAGQAFCSMLQRREAGEPVQYVLGHWAFRSLDLMVDRRVLIPRPETEVVVEVALGELARLGTAEPLVVDLGTGSGAIALAIAYEHSGAQVWGSDNSEEALAVASANLSGIGSRVGGRARFVQGSWWEALPTDLMGSVDLVVTNPPYVSETELEELTAEVSNWEPLEALVAGRTGLEALEAVIAGAPQWLAERAALVSEIAPQRAGAAAELATKAGFGEVVMKRDLAGRERVLVARR